MAEALSVLIRKVCANRYLIFRSSDNIGKEGIPFGKSWYDAILENLKTSDFVICLITPASVGRPWILYEAGFGAAHTTVFGIAVGFPEYYEFEGPFSSFQNCDGSPSSLVKMLKQLLAKFGGDQDDGVLMEWCEEFIKLAEKLILPTDQIPTTSVEMYREVKAIANRLPQDIEKHFEKTHNMLGQVLQTSYAGGFPDFFNASIIDFLQGAKQEILIACDFPNYGAFSVFDVNQRYLKLLKEKQLAGVDVRMVILDAKARRKLNHVQFGYNNGDWGVKVVDFEFKEKLNAFCKRLGIPEDSLDGNIKSFHRAVAKNQDEAAKKLNLNANKLGTVNTLMPVYLWIADGKRGVFSIPTFGEDALEHAFSTRNENLVNALVSIWNRYAELARIPSATIAGFGMRKGQGPGK